MKHTIEEIKLKNGARGLFIDVEGATVMSFEFQFRAGNRYVRNHDIYETAHIMEHMAFGANELYKSEHEFEEEFTRNGAYHNASTSSLSMSYVASCADFEWDRILELQRVSICQPKFNATELEAEKGNVRSELTGYLNNHSSLLWPKMQQALGEDILNFQQRIATINTVTLRDIKEHHARTHTAKNMRFVIAGKLTGRKKRIREMLEQWQLSEGERFAIVSDNYKNSKPVLIRRKEATNLTFGWSLVLPRILNRKELRAMGALDHILTGTMHSRIYGSARKKGLAYGVYSSTVTGFFESFWDFSGQVNFESAEELFDIIVRELSEVLDQKITEEELDLAKSYALGKYQMGAQTVGQIAGFYTGSYFHDDTVNNYLSVPKGISATKINLALSLAHEFISKGYWALGGVSSGDRTQLLVLEEKINTLREKARILDKS